MRTSCILRLEMPSQEVARNIAKALELDNAGYIFAEVQGNIIVAKAEADDLMTLRNTLDDYLACMTVAYKSLD